MLHGDAACEAVKKISVWRDDVERWSHHNNIMLWWKLWSCSCGVVPAAGGKK
jgi:hypothetical protein